MGFGHRVYKNYDPRAKIIKQIADEVFEVTGRNPLLDIALELEKIALDDEYFVERKLYPNVDFYSGSSTRRSGCPVEMFPVMFAIPRTAGWLAQWLEMLEDPEQKIARPRQVYIGAGERDYVPIGERRGSPVAARGRGTCRACPGGDGPRHVLSWTRYGRPKRVLDRDQAVVDLAHLLLAVALEQRQVELLLLLEMRLDEKVEGVELLLELGAVGRVGLPRASPPGGGSTCGRRPSARSPTGGRGSCRPRGRRSPPPPPRAGSARGATKPRMRSTTACRSSTDELGQLAGGEPDVVDVLPEANVLLAERLCLRGIQPPSGSLIVARRRSRIRSNPYTSPR